MPVHGDLPRPGSASITGVAALAGVSRQTVSNAINAPDRLHPDTLHRVRAAIDELGYRPNRSARMLRTRSAGLIGYCIPQRGTDVLNPVMDRFLHALSASIEATGRHVLLFTATDSGLPVYDDLLAQAAVDGFVLSDTVVADPRPAWLAARRVPFATFGRTWTGDREPGPWVDVDGAAGVAAALRHLHGRGHRSIGFLGWPAGSGVGDDRLRGWRLACSELGLGHDESLVARAEEAVPAGRAAAARLLALRPRPTALVSVTDTLALGALLALADLGLRPGHDVALVGFDDAPLAAAVPPGLTTLHQPIEEVAAQVVRMLDGAVDPAAGVLLEPRLVVRGTTAPDPEPADT